MRPASGANDLAVAEYVIAGLFMLLRGAYHAGARVLAGEWPRTDLMGREVAGRRLGLIGFGAIGRAVASRARALGMTVAAYDPYVSPDDPAWAGVDARGLDDIVGESDALSLHVPLTDETRHLIDGKALSRMRPGAVLINAARGGVVDEDALAGALRAGTLGGAMLDVFENEPLAAGSPLEGVPNLILTPHIAGLSEDSHRRISAVTAANVRRVLEGS
ncbi:MAG: NAD(P)-dependent oxidoreductase [Rhodospirillales bacterium]